MLYNSPQWRKIRQQVIIRDNGCDLAIEDRPIFDKILIHHINPITIKQVTEHDPMIFDLNNLVCVSYNTHEAIHFSNEQILIPSEPVKRFKGDTKLW